MCIALACRDMDDFRVGLPWLHTHMLRILMSKTDAMRKLRYEHLRRRGGLVPGVTWLQFDLEYERALRMWYHVYELDD